MTNKSKTITPAIHALLRSQDHLPAQEVQQMNDLVPDFAARYSDDYFKDRAASRKRKNLITGSTLFVSVTMSIAIIISPISGRPVGQSITSLAAPVISVIGSAINGFMNRK